MINSTDIQHVFKTRAHDLKALFDGTNTMAAFMRKLEAQALLRPHLYDRDKYVGDGFEFLIEIFLKTHFCDNTIGISEYEPIQVDDTGADGIGKNINGEKCVIQIKYRTNTTGFLTANTDHLSNLINAAQNHYGISTIVSEKAIIKAQFEKGNLTDAKYNKAIKQLETSAPRHYVFTTASGLHHYTDNTMFNGQVKCYGINELRAKLDNNIPFWDTIRKIASEI